MFKKEPRKKALLVGLNKYHPSLNADLRGCVNDVETMREILITLFGFDPENIRVIVDSRATYQGIAERLNWLIVDSRKDDELVFHYSGHGCFSGDTSISLLDGTEKTFKELVDSYRDKKFWVYSCTEDGRIVPGLAHSPRVTKYSKVLKITLDNNEVIKCTPDHKFMLRNGTYKKAEDLTKKDSLMPLYRRISNKKEGDRLDGYEMCHISNPDYLPSKIFYSNDGYYFTHQLIAYESGYLNGGYKGVVHHKDFNKRNNNPDNIPLMKRNDHAEIHSHTTERKEKDRQRMIHYNTVIHPKRIKEDPEYRKKCGKASSKARKKDWQKKEYRKKVSIGLKKSYNREKMDEDPRVIALHQNRAKSHTKESRAKAVGSFKNTIHKSRHVNRGIIKKGCELCEQNVINHKIIKIEEMEIKIPVYDITVEKYHNFALSGGAFVHNSQVRDRNGDELSDNMDEILCPYDLDWNNPFTDDILAGLFKKVHKHANLTMIGDACHSGSISHSGAMTRGLNNPGKIGNPHSDRFLTPPFDIISRSLDRELPKSTIGKKQEGSQKHVLLSGCRDDQTSADAYIDNKFQGAMTWALSAAIRDNSDITWRKAHQMVLNRLQRYTQIPQISGDDNLLDRPIFGGK